MASQNKQKNANRQWLDKLAFPPVLLVPMLIVLLARGRSSAAATQLSVPLAVSFLFLYGGLSLAYLTLQKKGQRSAAWSTAILADALLLVFASSQMGAPAAFGWGGVALVILGLILAVSQLSPPPEARFAKHTPGLLPENVGKAELHRFVSAITFPTAILETNEAGEERVLAANDALATILGRVTDKLDGVLFSELISPELESRALVFADAEWVSHRTAKGKQTMFMLSPAVRIPKPEPVTGENAIVDAETGLYTPYYMAYKAESDVQSCRRYKRRLALLLFRLEFMGKNLIPPNEETKRAAFVAFSQMVAASIRICDAAYQVAENEIVVFLPDTSQQGAKVVQMRISDGIKKIGRVEVPELAAVHLSDAAVNFFGEEIVSLDQVMQELYLAKDRSDK